MKHPVPDPIDEREWQAQEQAMRAAGGRAAGVAEDAHYRAVAEAIVTAPLGAPPPGFSAAVVAQLARRRLRNRRLATLGLGLAAIGGLVACSAYSLQAWLALHAAVGGEAATWLAALAGMAGLSWVCRQALAMIETDREGGLVG